VHPLFATIDTAQMTAVTLIISSADAGEVEEASWHGAAELASRPVVKAKSGPSPARSLDQHGVDDTSHDDNHREGHMSDAPCS
jgi:hypothetical protein